MDLHSVWVLNPQQLFDANQSKTEETGMMLRSEVKMGIIGMLMVFIGTSGAVAQQNGVQKMKRARACTNTYDSCVAGGVHRGWTSTEAGRYCSNPRNNLGCK